MGYNELEFGEYKIGFVKSVYGCRNNCTKQTKLKEFMVFP